METLKVPWVLVGGQLMTLMAAEHGMTLPRPTLDADVLIDVRAAPGSIRRVSTWLLEQGLAFDGASPELVGHRFSRPADPGPGTVSVDLLAPEGLGTSTDTTTVPPARTVQVPASGALLASAQSVDVTIRDLYGSSTVGRVNRPSVLAALIGKAAATSLPVRSNRERDWQDAALLAAVLPDPRVDPTALSRSERAHMRRLAPLADVDHPAWRVLPPDRQRVGRTVVRMLLDAVS
ncbi:hypothetical protein HC031_05750 [Planosporangium thailandense]|uniref:Nucleotidyl transferase AbiEii/AbiGii toxin family protein n=1 Tax=Planosporangium thailandense TaxID=765197 RepID=A0ABX0XTB5_9ACTN|nr:hypothetical protein [Planosporangium thailandense]NJC69223.1 hypothetical protein [Planosporangium thailandense]